MILTVLIENHAGGRLTAEHGLSYLIEIDDKKILFDAGHSNAFIKNAEKLGINLQDEVDTVVLSHGHWDHGDGMQYMNNKTLITHPLSFISRYRKTDMTPIGLTLGKKQLEKNFRLILSDKPYKIYNSVYFLGEIPRLNNFEAQTTTFVTKDGQPDFVPDDSALAVILDNSLIIVTGCSHSGICNIIEYAKKVTGIETVKTVIGGFHLKKNNKQTEQTIAYLKEQNIEHIFPSHCTEFPALVALNSAFKIPLVKTGMVFNFSLKNPVT